LASAHKGVKILRLRWPIHSASLLTICV
jgi:hypothetical protein